MKSNSDDNEPQKRKKPRRHMGKRCSAWGCGKLASDGVGIFQFPDPERSPARFNYWRDVVEYTRADFTYNKNSSFLCSDHFEEDQIENYFRIQFQRKADPAAKVKWIQAKGACPSVALLPPLPRSATSRTPGKKKSRLCKSATAPNCPASRAYSCLARAKRKCVSKRIRMLSVDDVMAMEDEQDCEVQTGDTAMNESQIEEDNNTFEVGEQSHSEKTAFGFSQKEPSDMDAKQILKSILKEVSIQEEDHNNKEIKEESLEDEAYSDASFDPLSTCKENLFEVYQKEESITDDEQTDAGLCEGAFLKEENIDLSQDCLEIKKESLEDKDDQQADIEIPEGVFLKEEDINLNENCIEIKEESIEYDTGSDSQLMPLPVRESVDENIADRKMRKKHCGVCNKRISFYYLKVHMRIHTKEKPFACDICNKAFTIKGSLVKHMQIHTKEKLFTCNICKSVFPQREILRQHKRVHRNEKRYCCDVCKRVFTRKASLRYHMEIHIEEKTIACEMCNKVFALRETLLSHMRMHQTDRLFICDTCNKGFTQKSTLIRHKRIHRPKRKFTCKICNKSFFQKRTLKEHMQTHKKPFKCKSTL